jgi:nitrogen fixation protein FixH
MELNADDLTKYTDVELENIEKGIAKEKKRRAKAAKIRTKLEKQANALGYTLAQKADGNPDLEGVTVAREEHPQKEQAKEQKESKPTSGWSLGSYTSS